MRTYHALFFNALSANRRHLMNPLVFRPQMWTRPERSLASQFGELAGRLYSGGDGAAPSPRDVDVAALVADWTTPSAAVQPTLLVVPLAIDLPADRLRVDALTGPDAALVALLRSYNGRSAPLPALMSTLLSAPREVVGLVLDYAPPQVALAMSLGVVERQSQMSGVFPAPRVKNVYHLRLWTDPPQGLPQRERRRLNTTECVPVPHGWGGGGGGADDGRASPTFASASSAADRSQQVQWKRRAALIRGPPMQRGPCAC
jgi:hypothetical protein